MTGPGKRDDELRAAVAAGVRAITVESPGELAPARGDRGGRGRASAGPAAGRGRREAPRLERVRLVGDDGAGKFGMDATTSVAAPGTAAASPHLDLLGLHAFGASNVLDAGALAGPRGGDGRVGRATWLASAGHRRSASSTPAAGSASRTSRTRNRSTWPASGRGSPASRAGWAARPAARATRGCCSSPADSWSARPAPTSPASSTASGRRARGGDPRRRRPPPPAAGPGRPGAPGPRRSAGAGRRPAGRLQPVTVAGPLCSGLDVFSQAAVMLAARGRRPGRRPRRRRLRLHRVDAALPVAPDPGGGRHPGRPGGAHPAAAGPRGVAGSPAPPGVVRRGQPGRIGKANPSGRPGVR